ncbi:MAG: hypothetical protein ACE1ZI_04765 [Acidobacteriota bacterium]
MAVLERGYAIVTTTSKEVVRDPDQIREGDEVGVRVQHGQFRAQKL